jgi:hypothetical protein
MLYDNIFLSSIPCPEAKERRSIVNLKANYPWLLHKLNNWYEELLPKGDPDLASRLRSMNSEGFTSAFWELVIFKYLRQVGHSVLYGYEAEGKKPDLYWPERDLIGDVISVSDSNYGEREEIFLHELEKHINNLPLPFNVFITSFHFSGTSYHGHNILDWFKSLAGISSDGIKDEVYEYDDGESRIECIVLPRGEGPIVKAVGMFELDAEQMKKLVKRRIQEKVDKYKGLLVVFACSGLGFWNLKEDTLKFALYGDLQFVLTKDLKLKKVVKVNEDRVTNGIFNNRWHRGQPANTRLLAVIYVDRVVSDEKLFLRLIVYHNPFAHPSLSYDFFGGCAQFVVRNEKGDNIEMKMISEDLVVLNLS